MFLSNNIKIEAAHAITGRTLEKQEKYCSRGDITL